MANQPDRGWTGADLPLLGEPFPVELANTDYRRHGVDFLAADTIDTWFGHAASAADLDVPDPIPAQVGEALRRIRDATRLLLARATDAVTASDVALAVEMLHDEAARAPAHLALHLAEASRASWQLHHTGPGDAVLVAAVASRCILFLGGEDADRVRRCARPDCPMLFVQHHRARRFCHESCADSLRQARYYRRVRAR